MTSPLLLAILALAAPQAAPLKATPEKGWTADYTLKTILTFEGSEVVFEADLKRTVAALNEDGSFVVKSQQSEARMTHEGGVVNWPNPPAVFTTISPRGWPAAIAGEDFDSEDARFANLTTLVFPADPVKKEDEWKVLIPKNEELGTVPVEAVFTLRGPDKVEGLDALRISFKAKETEQVEHEGELKPVGRSEGSIWIDPANGMLLKQEIALTDAPLAGQSITGRFTLTIKKGETSS
jgi:hypothetical protein